MDGESLIIERYDLMRQKQKLDAQRSILKDRISEINHELTKLSSEKNVSGDVKPEGGVRICLP